VEVDDINAPQWVKLQQHLKDVVKDGDMSESIQSILKCLRCYGTRTMYAIAVSVQFAWSKLSTGDIESAIDTDVTEDKNALYLAI
jgi:hypothetical protein